MRPLTSHDLLRVFDLGEPAPGTGTPHARALALLAAVSPEEAWEDLVALPVGQREARLLSLYRQTFGSTLELYAVCPACGQELDLNLDADALLAQAEAGGRETPAEAPTEISLGSTTVRFRLLTSADLLAAQGAEDEVGAREALLEAAVIEAFRDGAPLPASELPEEVVDELGRRLTTADPLAEILLDLACPECEHAWRSPLDVPRCLEERLATVARHLLSEVHTLARAYGWREGDILALTHRRRQAYLQLLTGEGFGR